MNQKVSHNICRMWNELQNTKHALKYNSQCNILKLNFYAQYIHQVWYVGSLFYLISIFVTTCHVACPIKCNPLSSPPTHTHTHTHYIIKSLFLYA